VLEKSLESPLDCKEIKQVNPIENQSQIFKSINSSALSLLYGPYTTTGKTIAWTIWTLTGKVMSLLFYYNELVHAVMEAKFRPGKAVGIFQVESEGLRTKSTSI
ncbi:hypothetical protein ACVXKL_28955, partial [Klebsiella pneumoniae]